MSLLTLAQIRKSLPKTVDIDDAFGFGEGLRAARALFGPHVHILTRDIVDMYMGQPMYVVLGQSWWSAESFEDRAKEPRILIPVRVDAKGNLRSDTCSDNAGIYFQDGLAVTGGSDKVFVFLKKKPVRPVKKIGQTTRYIIKDAKRVAQKTPAGRKAPPGHAKDFAGQVARGVDGENWVSKKLDNANVYRWVKVKV
ncbi:hypothetical protein EBT31_18550 [bacterium]|jgi:hypothetical protein|nr:hypothetical protein [bacterium]